MSETIYALPAGLHEAIRFKDASEACRALKSVLTRWPVECTPVQKDFFLTIEPAGESGYAMYGPYLDHPRHYNDLADLVCAIVVQLAWANLRSHPNWLCLHGAAVGISGRLVLFPGTRRAGKSVMTACLAAEGHVVYTDDVLPARVGPDGRMEGVASGVAPRLRLPLPDGMADRSRQRIEGWLGLKGHQYAYPELPVRTIAAQGDAMPIAAIVLLERTQDGGAKLSPAAQADALHEMIVQNFARTRHAADILTSFHRLTEQVPLYALQYSDSTEAAQLLEKIAAKLPLPERGHFSTDALLPLAPMQDMPPASLNLAPGSWIVRGEVSKSISIQNQLFVADDNGGRIHHLDELSTALWRLLEQPTRLSDVIAMFQGAFPDQSPDLLARDIGRIVQAMAVNRLVKQAPDGIG